MSANRVTISGLGTSVVRAIPAASATTATKLGHATRAMIVRKAARDMPATNVARLDRDIRATIVAKVARGILSMNGARAMTAVLTTTGARATIATARDERRARPLDAPAGRDLIFGVEPVRELIGAAPGAIRVLYVKAGGEARFAAEIDGARMQGRERHSGLG